MIVSTFEACFDSTKHLYPGMRDRAYFSARAILQINTCARAQSHKRVPRYPIPTVSPGSSQQMGPDLQHIILILQRNFDTQRPVFPFPKEGTHNHLLWASNLLVDMTRVGPNPTLESHRSHLNVAVTNQLAIVANVLLMWYILLGGHVEEETFWAVDKPDALETILSNLSAQVTKIIEEPLTQQLMRLLNILAAWEKRPMCLTPIAYHRCSTISRAIGILEPNDVPAVKQALCEYRFRYQDPHNPSAGLGAFTEAVFSHIGVHCGRLRLGHTSHAAGELPQDMDFSDYACILPVALEIGFRHANPNRDWATLSLCHTPHHEWTFEVVFLGEDDETIVDAVGAWLADRNHILPGLCARYLAKRMERDTPFSPRLRQAVIHAPQRNWRGELTASGLEVVRLLNRLKVGMDDLRDEKECPHLRGGSF